MRISERKYAITGAGRGLGAALAIVMADAGARLVLLDRAKEALRDTADAIRNRAGQDVEIGIQSCIASAAIGSLILTRHLLPNLLGRQDADIHTVVSTSGLQNRPLDGGSVAFQACAKRPGQL
jgi:short-subunit dehydrogenase